MQTKCSAPGKVLIAGGYLVLNRPNIGLTIATTSKFHTTTSWQLYKNNNNKNDATIQNHRLEMICY